MIRATYIIHFDKPMRMKPCYGDGNHYVGFSNNVRRRWRQHLTKNGVECTITAVKTGVKMRIGRVIPSYRSIEALIVSDGIQNYCNICLKKILTEYRQDMEVRQNG